MARTRTLTQLIADVRYQADLEGQSATLGRHTDAQITRLLNQSIQAWRLLVSESGHERFKLGTGGTVAAGSSATPLAADFVRAFAVWAGESQTAAWWQLQPASWEELAATGTTTTGAPAKYRISGSAIILWPKLDRSYWIQLDYLPTGTDLATGADTLDGIAGWEDWVVFDAAIKACARDADASKATPWLLAERARIEDRIRRAAPRSAPKTRRVDTRGIARLQEVRAVYPWLVP